MWLSITPPPHSAAVEVHLHSRTARRGLQGRSSLHRRAVRRWTFVCPRGPHYAVLEGLDPSTAAQRSGGRLSALEDRQTRSSRLCLPPPPRCAAVGVGPSLGDCITQSPGPFCTPPPQNAAVGLSLSLGDCTRQSPGPLSAPPPRSAAVGLFLARGTAPRSPRASSALHRRVLRRWGSFFARGLHHAVPGTFLRSTVAFCDGGVSSPLGDCITQSPSLLCTPPPRSAAVGLSLPSGTASRSPPALYAPHRRVLRRWGYVCTRGPHHAVPEALLPSTAAQRGGGDSSSLGDHVVRSPRPLCSPPPHCAAVGLCPPSGTAPRGPRGYSAFHRRVLRRWGWSLARGPRGAVPELFLHSTAAFCGSGGPSAFEGHVAQSSTSCTTPPLHNAAVEVSLPSRAALRGPRGSTALHRCLLRRWTPFSTRGPPCAVLGVVQPSTVAQGSGGGLFALEGCITQPSRLRTTPPLRCAAVECSLPSRTVFCGPRGFPPRHCCTTQRWRLASTRGPRSVALELAIVPPSSNATNAAVVMVLRSGTAPRSPRDLLALHHRVLRRWSTDKPRGLRHEVPEAFQPSTATLRGGGASSPLGDCMAQSPRSVCTPPLHDAAVEVVLCSGTAPRSPRASSAPHRCTMRRWGFVLARGLQHTVPELSLHSTAAERGGGVRSSPGDCTTQSPGLFLPSTVAERDGGDSGVCSPLGDCITQSPSLLCTPPPRSVAVGFVRRPGTAPRSPRDFSALHRRAMWRWS
ncbi:hypothetical protein FISHEDRAFT_72007 [Fistulina hepatica ATCC 64428]|uniref:Uncharacterized protein n=1 Tax=Fistulina hepatica ATCC 64428 TaxID=1128425 RepID=A0A0D7AIG5_9AGAR|nr:hypothetical protein FISHEDRAFT_72007 [Fistulina hepatica ATCC 64428]